MAIAGGRVELQTYSRRPVEVDKGVTRDRSEGPGCDVSSVDASSLAHHLDVPVQIVELAVEPNVEDFAAFVACRIYKSSVGLGKMGIVAGEGGCIRKLSLYPRDTKCFAAAAVVVEGAIVQHLNWTAVKSDEFPGTGLVIGPGGIPGLA